MSGGRDQMSGGRDQMSYIFKALLLQGTRTTASWRGPAAMAAQTDINRELRERIREEAATARAQLGADAGALANDMARQLLGRELSVEA